MGKHRYLVVLPYYKQISFYLLLVQSVLLQKHWQLIKQAAFHTYPFEYGDFYWLQRTQIEEQIEYYKHGHIATTETYEPIVRWLKIAIKLHDIMFDHDVDLFEYEGEMEFVPIDDGKFYKMKDDNVKYHCLVKVNMKTLTAI